MVLRVGVLGAKGRMGAEVCNAISQAKDMKLVAALDAGDAVSTLASEGANVVVDFTNPERLVLLTIELLKLKPGRLKTQRLEF